MRAKITYAVTAAVLVVYFVLVGSRGVLLIQNGTLIPVTFGVAGLILPVIGVWFLWKNTQFVRRANALAAELDAEGGLPVDDTTRCPSTSFSAHPVPAPTVIRPRGSSPSARPRRRWLPTTGAAGSASPAPTT